MDLYKYSACRKKIICVFHNTNVRKFCWMCFFCFNFCPSSFFSGFRNIYFRCVIYRISCCIFVRSKENLDLIEYLLSCILEYNISIVILSFFTVFIVTPHCRVRISALICIYSSVFIANCFQII